MTNRKDVVTTNYRHWSGKTVYGVNDAGIIIHPDGEMTLDVLKVDRNGWQYLGIAPKPQSRWDWFWFDWHHGRIMRFDLLSVIVFCVRNYWRDSRKYLRK